jgi:hypothetical protein
MKNLIKLEELAMLTLSVFALYYFEQPWWVYFLLLIAPDISMLGYLAGNTIGAFSYNLFHHKGVAVFLFLSGIIGSNQILLITGIVLFGHSSLDRMLGFGLKYKEGFGFTHLGKIGKEK